MSRFGCRCGIGEKGSGNACICVSNQVLSCSATQVVCVCRELTGPTVFKPESMKYAGRTWQSSVSSNRLISRQRWAFLLLAFVWICFLFWCFVWFVYPLEWFHHEWWAPFKDTGYMYYNEGGLFYITLPVVLVALGSYLYLRIDRARFPRRTLPLGKPIPRFARKLLISGNAYLPNISVSELWWAAVLVGLIAWTNARYDWWAFRDLDTNYEENWADWREDANHLVVFPDSVLSKYFGLWELKFDYVVLILGWTAYIVLIPLFFPVSRGSVLLRVAGIPFEQAINYHRYMSHFMLWLAFIHSAGYWILWIVQGVLWKQATMWQIHSINNLAGAFCMLFGILIWVTAISPVRRKWFEVFFYTHQLYLLFILFLAMHLGEWAITWLFPSLLFYGLDRTLRLIQSQHLVKATGATVHADGCIEIHLPTSPDVVYKALDCIFICVPELSPIQWHPLSISSSPLDGQSHMSVLVKPMGSWTLGLQQMVGRKQALELKVVGPYGQEQDFFAKYDSLLLIAGGSGVVPFLSLLKDLLHRCRMKQQRLPANITLVYAVRSPEAAKVLEEIRAVEICPEYDSHINLNINVYVTGDSKAAKLDVDGTGTPLLDSTHVTWESDKAMVPQAFAGHEILTALMFLFVCGGTVAFLVIVERYMMNQDKRRSETFPRYVSGVTYMAGFVVGILLSTGIPVALWYVLRKHLRKAKNSEAAVGVAPETNSKLLQERTTTGANTLGFIQPPTFTYGSRPDLPSIFVDVAKSWENADIGVLVSGPTQMVDNVAAQCLKRSPGLLSFRKRPVFNFHSLSFTL